MYFDTVDLKLQSANAYMSILQSANACISILSTSKFSLQMHVFLSENQRHGELVRRPMIIEGPVSRTGSFKGRTKETE